MAADEYVLQVIGKHKSVVGPGSPAHQAGSNLAPVIRKWAGDNLADLQFSGSYAKDTAIHGTSDVDLFISLRQDTPGNLGDIHEKLVSYLQALGYSPRPQNVSVGVTFQGFLVDLVPARRQDPFSTDHSLFFRKRQTWKKTNVQTHINTVVNSGRLDEIRATKIWRKLNRLDFPSFYLELTVIEALRGKWSGRPAENFLAVLDYLSSRFPIARVDDPANSANIISDDLTTAEKQTVAGAAKVSRAKDKWEQIIW